MAKGWFSTPGRPGDRTLQDQKKGLDWLFENCAGKSILDIGCAEGLLDFELAKLGASLVVGVEIVREHFCVACEMAGAKFPGVLFINADANVWAPPGAKYDIVLMLAILHKLRNPTEVAMRMASVAREHVIIRLPPKHAPIVVDARSGNQPHNISDAMIRAGFVLEHQSYDGHFGEWVGRYKRVRDA